MDTARCGEFGKKYRPPGRIWMPGAIVTRLWRIRLKVSAWAFLSHGPRKKHPWLVWTIVKRTNGGESGFIYCVCPRILNLWACTLQISSRKLPSIHVRVCSRGAAICLSWLEVSCAAVVGCYVCLFFSNTSFHSLYRHAWCTTLWHEQPCK